MKKPIYISRPDITRKDINEVVSVLKSGNLVQGEKVRNLESSICNNIKTPYCAAVSNGTASLHLALLSLGIGQNDEVIIPAFSYIATANVIELVGAKPVFVDIDLDTFNIQADKIEEAITNKTKCIMVVHEFGLCAEMDKILKLTEKYQIPLIEDAACALGAQYKNRFAGTFGVFGSFSLHPRKSITSGEGGLVITPDQKLHRKIQILRNHGIDVAEGIPSFTDAGFNYRLTDFQAALALSQFKRLNKILSKRTILASIYLSAIKTNQIKLPKVPSECIHSWQSFHVLAKSGEERDKLIMHFREKNIFLNYGAQCIPYMEYYAKKYKLNVQVEFPNALRAYESGLVLPLCEKYSKKQITEISNLLNQYYRA